MAGAGIGGLAAAVALSHSGHPVQLLEQTQALAEVGAGIQLGPNAVRVLQAWGLLDDLRAVAAFPQRLEVRNALTAQCLATLPLGDAVAARYCAPYATLARADLQGLLLAAAQRLGVDISLQTSVQAFIDDGTHKGASHTDSIGVITSQGQTLQTPLLVGADGLWSRVRQQLLADTAPRSSGHVAYRAMVPQASLPEALRSQVVTAWLGPKFHVVQYPVRGGEWLNVVAIVQGQVVGDVTSWDHSANAGELRVRLANAQTPLLDLVHAFTQWRLWPLYDRPPMASAREQAQGRVALLGDAAHPMRPYLAQGAGMAIEDAQQLALSLQAHAHDAAAALAHYAQVRWVRNARVQARAAQRPDFSYARPAAAGARCGA